MSKNQGRQVIPLTLDSIAQSLFPECYLSIMLSIHLGTPQLHKGTDMLTRSRRQAAYMLCKGLGWASARPVQDFVVKHEAVRPDSLEDLCGWRVPRLPQDRYINSGVDISHVTSSGWYAKSHRQSHLGIFTARSADDRTLSS